MTHEDKNSESKDLTVDAVAKQLGITARTLRYYEEIGLISAARSHGGHRLYDEATVDKLKQILRLKEHLGISLQEIQDILEAEQSLEALRKTFKEHAESPERQGVIVERYVDVLQDLIQKMDAKLENISAMRRVYQERLDKSKRFLADLHKP